jgi:hypothetical protein
MIFGIVNRDQPSGGHLARSIELDRDLGLTGRSEEESLDP